MARSKKFEHPDLQSEHPGFFVAEADRAGNLSNNILFNSVLPKFVTSQSTPVANT